MRSTTTYSEQLTNYNLNGTKSLAPVSGRQFEVCGEFTIGSGNFGYNFYKNGSKMAKPMCLLSLRHLNFKPPSEKR